MADYATAGHSGPQRFSPDGAVSCSRRRQPPVECSACRKAPKGDRALAGARLSVVRGVSRPRTSRRHLAPAPHASLELAILRLHPPLRPHLGEIDLSAADNGTFVTIPLVPGVAAAVNGLLGSGRISLGGRIKTFDGTHIDELLLRSTILSYRT